VKINKAFSRLVGNAITPMVLGAVALVGIGVLAGITAQRNSVLAWALPFLGGLLAAGLFAVAAYKLTSSSIKRKGLILVSVPLVFLLVFVIFVTQLSRKSQQAQASYLQSNNVIAETESISAHLLDAEASIRGYVITGDPAFAQPFESARREVPNAIARLQTLVQGNPVLESRVLEMSARAAEKIAFQAATEQLVRSGARDQAIERIKTAEGLRIMNDFRRVREDFLREEQRVELERRLAVQSAWQRFNWLLVAGSTIDVFLTVILAILFSGGISKRVVSLTENAKALADDKPLNEPIQGTDEIAHLDHVFREMAKALREAARKERAIFDNALDLICSFDSEGRFLKVSPSSFKVWGYRPEELIGRRYTEFLVQEEIEKSEQAEQEILAGKSLTNFENCYRRKDGAKVNMLWSASWSETDNVMFAIARDITERKRAEAALLESEERYRLLFESNPHPIWVYDLETLAFLAVNSAAVLRYGYSHEEFLAMTITDIRPPEDIPALLNNVSKVSSGVDDAGSWRHRKKDGGIIDVEITSHQLIFAGRNAEIVLSNDITERKRAEAAINQLNENLEQRSVQLEQANKELEAFSYSVSHDLRAPLRAIDGFSRILLEDYSDKLDQDGNRVLEVVRKNAQQMGQLIDDLLAFSRLGRKAIELLPIDMGDLAKSAFEELNAADSQSHPRLKIGSMPPARGDRSLMRQVFVNLLSNAKKYSRLNEQPVIEVGGSTENGNHIYYVKDNGAGFDMQYANKLFGVFQRLHGPEEFEGTGVGLAIVQRIIHRHGGKVWAEGKVNEGATFYFTLPRESGRNGKLAEHE
jgi:PAS domain S-box-containing protein